MKLVVRRMSILYLDCPVFTIGAYNGARSLGIGECDVALTVYRPIVEMNGKREIIVVSGAGRRIEIRRRVQYRSRRVDYSCIVNFAGIGRVFLRKACNAGILVNTADSA